MGDWRHLGVPGEGPVAQQEVVVALWIPEVLKLQNLTLKHSGASAKKEKEQEKETEALTTVPPMAAITTHAPLLPGRMTERRLDTEAATMVTIVTVITAAMGTPIQQHHPLTRTLFPHAGPRLRYLKGRYHEGHPHYSLIPMNSRMIKSKLWKRIAMATKKTTSPESSSGSAAGSDDH